MSWIAQLGDRVVARLGQAWVDPQAVRAEALALGGRHRGRVIEGAELEMQAPDLPARRRALLGAVVRSERTRARTGP